MHWNGPRLIADVIAGDRFSEGGLQLLKVRRLWSGAKHVLAAELKLGPPENKVKAGPRRRH